MLRQQAVAKRRWQKSQNKVFLMGQEAKAARKAGVRTRHILQKIGVSGAKKEDVDDFMLYLDEENMVDNDR